MEDDEDYSPNDSGHLELRYRGWTDMESRVISFAHCLVSLDVSFNQLQTLPDEISALTFLKELNCSCNKLLTLPKTIASMEYLREIKANGNCINALPVEIGNCKALEVLNLSENVLTCIPDALAGCRGLHTLLLQNNDLPRLPLSLAALAGTIQQLDVSNNNEELLTTIPAAIHRDVSSIIWLLSVQKDSRHDIDRLKQETMILERDNIGLEKDLANAKEKIASLDEEKLTLEADFDDCKNFLIARSNWREFRREGWNMWESIKRAWATRSMAE